MNIEFLKIVRNPKRKYILFILLFIMAAMASSTNFKWLGFQTVNDMGNLVAAVCVFTVDFLLYSILKEAEVMTSWKVKFAFPLSQRGYILKKTAVLLLIQIPIILIGVFINACITREFDMALLHYLISVSFIYLTGFLYYTDVCASGFLSMAGSIVIVNVLNIMTPVFLLTCLCYFQDWFAVFDMIWLFIVLCSICLMSILIMFCDYFMRRKLYREVMLFKMFNGLSLTYGDIIKERYRNIFDKCMQIILRLFVRSPSMWKKAAQVELMIKLNGAYILCLCLAIWLWYASNWLIFGMTAIYCLYAIIKSYVRDGRKIHHIMIT